MKLQLTPRFPVSILGAGRISITKANGIVTISDAPAEPTILVADGVIPDAAQVIAIGKNAPALTNLALPSVKNRGGTPLLVIDWSTAVVNHQIVLTPFGTETVLRQASYSIYSTALQLGGALLYPSITLNGWFIAP